MNLICNVSYLGCLTKTQCELIQLTRLVKYLPSLAVGVVNRLNAQLL